MSLSQPVKRRRAATKTQRTQLYLMQDGNCAICGDPLGDRFDVDHLHPFSESGETEIWNLQAVCLNCHRVKTSGEAKRRCLSTSA